MRARLSILTVVVGAAALAVGMTIARADGTPLKPNFVSAVPHHFTVQNSQQHEFLRFSNGIANVGDGPFQIRPEVQSDGKTHGIQQLLDATGAVVHEEDVSEFLFHPEHNHWHINAVALYEFRSADDDGTHGQWGAVFGDQSLKTTFCLIDWIRLEGNSKNTARVYADCKPDAPQGLSPGWLDQYHHPLEGQELDISGAPPGIYYLVTTANPDHKFIETDTTDNTAWTSLQLTRDSKGNAKLTEISHSPCSGALCGENLPNR